MRYRELIVCYFSEDTEGLSDIKKAVREAIGCSEETVTKVVRDMTLRGNVYLHSVAIDEFHETLM